MPSHLVPMNPDAYDRWVEDAEDARPSVQFRAGSPWPGLTPDLDPHQTPPGGMAVSSVGLIARPGPSGEGEVLIPDAGYRAIDGANLPLTTDATPAAPAAGNTAISMLGQFNRTTAAGAKTSGTEYDGPTLLALVAGDGTNVGSAELWRVKPSDGTWNQVLYETVTGTPDATKEPMADRETLPDWAEFPAGAPARGDFSAEIDEPVFVWCGLSPEGIGDNVMVYPNDNTTPENAQYEPLVKLSFNGTFKARTVEHFGGRLYFGNTIEDTTQYRQRIRRTALFTADPLVTNPGAGAFDVRDFSGDLLRLEKLGDLMVAYFTDGTAFIRLSDIATAPDRVQLLREKRGLLATHAVCSVGAQEHFGIFDDGWYFLDPSGRWTEVGMLNLDGVMTPKWKETFYNTIDMNYRHRTVINYDGRYVRIAFTALQGDGSDDDNQEVWIFDPRGNRLFRDTYPVTVWGEANLQIRPATAWNAASIASETWSSISGSWASYAAKFGVKSLVHGSTTGYVVAHDYDLISRFNTNNGQTEFPIYTFASQKLSFEDPTELKTALKLWLEYIHTLPGSVTLSVTGDTVDGGESGQVSFSTTGDPGDIDVLFRTFNFTSRNIQFSISGTAPVMIRSIIADLTMKGRQIGESIFVGSFSGTTPVAGGRPQAGQKSGGRR